MGKIDPIMADTPDPKDTGAVGMPENGNPDETTVFQPVGLVEDTDTTDSNAHNRPKWLIPAIAAGVAVVVLGAGFGGYAYALNNVSAGVNAASSWNKASVKTLQGSVEDAQALLDGTSEDQVADPQVLEALSSAIDKARTVKGVNETPNGLFVWELLDAENKYDESTNNILDLDTNLSKAMKAVEQNVQDKILADAKDALSKAIDSTQSTLDGSDGKVQDNATRDALSKALETARKTLDGSDAEAMNAAKSDLETKTNAVNDSVKAKEQADKEAQAQAEAEAAANAAVQQAQQSYTPVYSPTPAPTYTPSSGNNGGYTPTQQPDTGFDNYCGTGSDDGNDIVLRPC